MKKFVWLLLPLLILTPLLIMKGCFRQGGINMIGTIHKEIVVDGKRYNFKIVSAVFRDEVVFYIRAIFKFTKRTSCINNLNAVLSELLAIMKPII